MLVLLLLVGSFVVFATVLASIPRLLVRPAIRSSLWKLRDEVFDARRRGTLSDTHRAPIALTRRIEDVIAIADDVTVVRMLLAYPAAKKLPDSVKAEMAAWLDPDLTGLDLEQIDIYRAFEKRFNTQVLVLPVAGTWLGWLIALVSLLPLTALGVIAIFSKRAHDVIREEAHDRRITTEEVAYELSRGGSSDRSMALL